MKYIAAVITAALATNAFAQESGTTTQNTPQEANNANSKEVALFALVVDL